MDYICVPIFKSMKKSGVFLCVLALAFNAPAQTQYENVSKVLGQLDAVMLSKDNSSRSKLKQIEFDDCGYSIESYFKMNTLEPGNPVFFSKLVDRKLILVGKVTKANKALTVNGVKFQDDGTMLYGLFQVSNSDDGSISYKPRKAGPLEITDIDLTFVSGSDHGTPVILDFKNSNVYLDGKTGKTGWLSLNAHIKNPSTFDYDNATIRRTIMTMKDNVEIEYGDHTFRGSVETADVEGKSIKITPLEGYGTYADGRTATLRCTGNNLELTVSKEGEKDCRISVPLSQISRDEWWNIARIEELYAQNLEKEKKPEQAKTANTRKPAAPKTATQEKEDVQVQETEVQTGHSAGLIAGIAAGILVVIVSVLLAGKRRKKE